MCNLPSLVLKARHLGGSAFCRLGMPEQALGGIPLDFGIVSVVEDKTFLAFMYE